MADIETDAADQLQSKSSSSEVSRGFTSLWGRYRSLPRNVIAIGLVSLLNDASSEIIYPLLPIFLTMTLGASARAIGIIEGLAESISSLLKLFAGFPCYRLAKRKPL